jgi:hypothetical protein
MVRMKLGGIFRMVLFGFLVPGVAARMSRQSPPSPDRGAEQSSQAPQAQPQVELKRFSLLSGTSIDISPDWIEREQMPLPPSPRLAPSAPQVTFLEFMALENPKMHSALRISTTTNPFLGGDEVALDVQMHSGTGSGKGLADYLFYFFFSPPRDCLDGGSEAYRNAKSQAELSDQTVSPDLSIRTDCKHAPALADFYSRQLSPGVLFQVTNGVELAGGIYPEFYLMPMEKVEANGLTFYVFEAQGRRQLDLATVNHFNLPDEMQGAQADFFWAVGAPSPFPFFRDPQRKNVPVIQVAYAGIGLGPDKRAIFMRLLRQVHSLCCAASACRRFPKIGTRRLQRRISYGPSLVPAASVISSAPRPS